MKVSSLAAAKDELVQAVAWYNEQRAGLGDDFAKEFERAILRIVQHPNAWGRLSINARCCRLKRFPYGIIYTVLEDEILVVAVMHLHRRPGYWEDRIP